MASLKFNTTGNANTAYGGSSLFNNSAGSYNTAVGAYADVNGNLENATSIGYRAMVEQSNSLILGSIAGINEAQTMST